MAKKVKPKKGRNKKQVRYKKTVKQKKKKQARSKTVKNQVKQKRKTKKKKEIQKEKEKLESYKINVDNAVVDVEIWNEPSGYNYYLKMPEMKEGTKALLNNVRNQLVSSTNVGASELTDLKVVNEVKERFQKKASNLLKNKLPSIDDKKKKFLSGLLMQEMLGLGEIEFLVNDTNLEEIVILSSKEPVRVYHRSHGWLKTNLTIKDEKEIVNHANIIARRAGRQINVLEPLLDAHLITGDRANAVLSPISTKGNTITIRKFSRDPFTIVDLINSKTVNFEVAALLWLAIEYEMNVLISGGTASGKTVFLNACMPFVPPTQRIISMEDTRELMLPSFLYWCPLVVRTANPEGKGEVSMLDLLMNSLRMRPDRVVLGEMRKEKQAEVLFEAMHTGHSVYSTLHAETVSETISRLTNPPLNVPSNLLGAVDLNVVMFRDRKRSIRRVFQVGEFLAASGQADSNILYRWMAQNDKILPHNTSQNFMEKLSRNTAMSSEEVEKSLEYREKILKWMCKNKLRSLKNVGKVMNLYYTNKKELDKIVKENNLKKLN